MTGIQFAAAYCLTTTSIQLLSCALAAPRCAKRTRPLPAPADAPPVTLVRPLCGVDPFAEETLASSFALDYPSYELIFCLASADDPVAPMVRRLIEANPKTPARLLIGDDRPSGNPKLNNVVKGWKAARHQWIIIADSNVLMPRDYIQRLMARWRAEHRHCLRAADRLGAEVSGCRARMRIPQQLSGALAIYRRGAGLRLCARQEHVVAALDTGGGRRHRGSRRRDRRRRRGDQADPSRRPQRPSRRRAVRAAARTASMARGLGARRSAGRGCGARPSRCSSRRSC